jgi:hypothetical protein
MDEFNIAPCSLSVAFADVLDSAITLAKKVSNTAVLQMSWQ